MTSIHAIPTADLCDDLRPDMQVAEPLFTDYGGHTAFHGPVATLKVFEDNSLVRAELVTEGKGRVLVIDGGGSLHCALVGDRLAALAAANGWTGIVVSGCVRDVADLADIPIGIKALAAMPRKSIKQGKGERDVTVSFAGVTFRPGAILYADADGIVVAESAP